MTESRNDAGLLAQIGQRVSQLPALHTTDPSPQRTVVSVAATLRSLSLAIVQVMLRRPE